MHDKELNKLVAEEIMGFVPYTLNDHEGWKSEGLIDGWEKAEVKYKDATIYSELPNFVINMVAAAWLVKHIEFTWSMVDQDHFLRKLNHATMSRLAGRKVHICFTHSLNVIFYHVPRDIVMCALEVAGLTPPSFGAEKDSCSCEHCVVGGLETNPEGWCTDGETT